MLLLSANALFFTSCEDDKDTPPAPTVKITELGSGHDTPNDKTAYAGSNVHINAEINAEGLVQSIMVEIHQEEGEYSFNKEYTDSKYAGAKNPSFHEHIDIPEDAPEGAYHLHFTVTDKEGQTGSAEAELTVKPASEAPGHDDHDGHDDHGHEH